ncbi:MAG: hypothetical protein ACRDTA_03115 [Pseudonocardiaceae bacterium]
MLTDALTVQLSSADDLWVVGSCTPDDPRLTDIVRTLRPDVITTDIGPSAVATSGMVRTLSDAWPAAHLVILTGNHDTAHAAAAARAGAAAWVSKESSLDHLLEVLHAVPLGHAFYPPQQLGVVLRDQAGGAQPPRGGERRSRRRSSTRRRSDRMRSDEIGWLHHRLIPASGSITQCPACLCCWYCSVSSSGARRAPRSVPGFPPRIRPPVPRRDHQARHRDPKSGSMWWPRGWSTDGTSDFSPAAQR